MNNKFIVKILLIAFSFSLLFSCSNVLPEIHNASSKMIYEFMDGNSLPELRLSVFVEVSSDVHRAQNLKAVCNYNDYEWEVSNPIIIESGKRQYAGYTNFVMPMNEDFAAGLYSLYYEDANEDSKETTFSVSFNKELSKMKTGEAEKFLQENKASKYLAFYNDAGTVVYYGKFPNESDFHYLKSSYSNAKTYKIIWFLEHERIMCIMPENIL